MVDYQEKIKELEKRIQELEYLNDQLESAIERANQIAFDAEMARFELDLIFNTADNGLCVIDKEFRIIKVNRSFAQLFKIDPNKIINKPCTDVLKMNDCGTERCPLSIILSGKTETESDVVLRNEHGESIYLMRTATPYRDPSGEILGALLSFKDITPRKKLEDKLRELATTDALTGILNRREFLDRTNNEFEKAKRYKHQLSMITLDIDDFKKINDTYGHDVGDMVLKALADIGKSTIRKIDIFGRLGGEEFGITLPETGPDGAYHIAERLRKNVQEYTLSLNNGREIRFTISIGIGFLNKDIKSIQELYKQSDMALYRAKLLGKNRVETYTNSIGG